MSPTMAEVSDYDLTNVLRVVVAAAALWLAMLVLRVAWMRRDHPEAQHWLVYVSYAVALVMISGIRAAHWGEPPTFDLWLSVVVVVTGAVGLLMRHRIRRTPPWRR